MFKGSKVQCGVVNAENRMLGGAASSPSTPPRSLAPERVSAFSYSTGLRWS